MFDFDSTERRTGKGHSGSSYTKESDISGGRAGITFLQDLFLFENQKSESVSMTTGDAS
jgi:hypothetical protein